MRLYIFILFSLLALSAGAQSVFTGTVKSQAGEPMTATITVQPTGSNAIAGFVTTDSGGKYRIEYKGTGDSLIITVRGLTLEKITRRVANRSATVDFTVTEKVGQLSEVKVVASPVRRKGDTLTYAVAAFRGQNDRTIEDVIKKMPGMEVSSSGGISYNGKKINKFYIEDADLLGGRYALATKNINAGNVASVQVYENHQPIKAETAFSDQAAVNLKLKDGAKGVWTLNALAGAGYQPAMWNAELTAMHFARNRQHISVYKGNNSGQSSKEELSRKYDDESLAAARAEGSMLAVSEPGTPSIAPKRYLRNVSNSVSANQLFRLKRSELTANVTYYNERLWKDGYSSSTQFLPGGDEPLVVEESIGNRHETNDLDVSVKLRRNERENYLSNTLNVKTIWSNARTEAFSQSNRQVADAPLSQYLDKPSFAVSNALSALKRADRKMFRINFSLNYNDRPHRLTVVPAGYFGDGSWNSLSQEVLLKSLDATLRGSFGLMLGKFTVDYSPYVTAELRKLDTELTGTDTQGGAVPTGEEMRNDLWFNNYRIGVEQNYAFNKEGRFRLRLRIPAYLAFITTDDRLRNSTVCHRRGSLSPTLYASYQFSPSFQMVLNGHYGKGYGSLNDVYTGYLLQSYRNLLRNSANRLFESSSVGSGLSLEYRDAIRMLFFNAGAKYQRQHKNLFYGYNYEGIVGVKTFIDQPTDADTYSLYGSASKTWRFWQTKISLSAGVDWRDNGLLLQNKVEQYHATDYLAGVSLNTSPCRYVNVAYDFAWLYGKQSVENAAGSYPELRSHAHNFKVGVFPTGAWSVNFNVDYRYFNETGSRNTMFADAQVRYKHKNTEWELECNNLFNSKQYVSTTHSGMGIYVSRYELRPLSFLLKVRFKLK